MEFEDFLNRVEHRYGKPWEEVNSEARDKLQ